MKYSEIQINVRSMGLSIFKCMRGDRKKNDKNDSKEGKSKFTLQSFYKTLKIQKQPPEVFY